MRKCPAYAKKLSVCLCSSLPFHEFCNELGKRILRNWFRLEGFVERRQQVRSDLQGVGKGLQGSPRKSNSLGTKFLDAASRTLKCSR